MNSLQVTDAASATVAVAPRVKLEDIEAAIAHRFDTTADQAIIGALAAGRGGPFDIDPLKTLSICLLVMTNGHIAIGESRPASPENFDRELGRKFAYEDAVRKLWPLMGFALREKLSTSVG